MTPAQEAKEYAAQHDIVIRIVGRRYWLFSPESELIDEVGGYPAALNAMKRYVQQQAESSALEQARETGNVGAIVGDVNATKVEIVDSGRMIADFPFDDDASWARIRAEARRINKPECGSPEWFARHPWRIISSGSEMSAYATRSDALKVVRRFAAGRSDITIVYMGA